MSSPDSVRISSRVGKSFPQTPAREQTNSVQGRVSIEMLGTNKFSKSENFPRFILRKSLNNCVNLFSDSHNLVLAKVQFSFMLAE